MYYNIVHWLKASHKDREQLVVGGQVLVILPHEFRRKGVELGTDQESVFWCEVVQNDNGGLFVKILDYSDELKRTLAYWGYSLDDFYKHSIRVGKVIRFRYTSWAWRLCNEKK